MKVILVPGAGNPTVMYRVCEGALRLYLRLQQEGEDVRLLLTGGKIPSDQPSQAEMMADWFKDQGIPSSAMLLEPESLDTAENVMLSLIKLCEAHLGNNLIVVAHWLHLPRFWIIFTYLRLRKQFTGRMEYVPLWFAEPLIDTLLGIIFIPYQVIDPLALGRFAKLNRAARSH